MKSSVVQTFIIKTPRPHPVENSPINSRQNLSAQVVIHKKELRTPHRGYHSGFPVQKGRHKKKACSISGRTNSKACISCDPVHKRDNYGCYRGTNRPREESAHTTNRGLPLQCGAVCLSKRNPRMPPGSTRCKNKKAEKRCHLRSPWHNPRQLTEQASPVTEPGLDKYPSL